MYRKIEDFLHDWAYETEMTLNVFKNLNDESFHRAFHDDHRTISRLSLHITQSAGEMMHEAGLPLEKLALEPEDISAERIVGLYEKEAAAVKEAVMQNWTDEQLTEQIQMYGEEWTKGMALGVLIRHQAHHRGQLTILMRQAGLRVPGVYGPSKEEWEAMGMPALA